MNKRLEGISVLSVIAPEDFNDDEYRYPRRILEAEGASVHVAGPHAGTAHGMFGLAVEPDLILAQVRPENYHAITIAGGSGAPRSLWKDPSLQEIVRALFNQGKVIAAICLSPVVLAEAGLLRGLEATVYKSPKAIERMRQAGALVVDQEVVQVGRILTGRDPQAAEAYGMALAKAIWSEVLKKPYSIW